MNPTRIALAALTLVVACGGEKPAAESTPAPAPPPVQAPPPDRIGAAPARADSAAKPKADTSKKAAAKGDNRMRDSAFGPTYSVDSTGKVTKIKKP